MGLLVFNLKHHLPNTTSRTTMRVNDASRMSIGVLPLLPLPRFVALSLCRSVGLCSVLVAADMGKPETLEAAIPAGSSVVVVTPGAEDRTAYVLRTTCTFRRRSIACSVDPKRVCV